MSSLAPTAWLKFGRIIDNPWSNARALAEKTGKVLGTLLADRAFGARPATLVGYSLGSLVIFHALEHLSKLTPAETTHIIQDVYVFGSPASVNNRSWSSARRIVAGRFINGYAKPEDDYILAILSRFSVASASGWGVAGLQPVEVAGIENVLCEGVKGHVAWRGLIGSYLTRCGVPGLRREEVEAQQKEVVQEIERELEIADVSDTSTLTGGMSLSSVESDSEGVMNEGEPEETSADTGSSNDVKSEGESVETFTADTDSNSDRD